MTKTYSVIETPKLNQTVYSKIKKTEGIIKEIQPTGKIVVEFKNGNNHSHNKRELVQVNLK